MSTMTTLRSGAFSAALTITVALVPAILGGNTSCVQAADNAAIGSGLNRSARSGPWSAPATWEGNKVPAAGARVQIRQGHSVIYDLKSDQVIRSIHVAGTLRFPHDKDT